MPLCHRRRLKFIHIPKTGGTSIVRSLALEPTGYHSGWWDYPDATKDYISFTVVRDPFARFVSQYNYAMSYITHWHQQGTANEYPDLASLREMTLLDVIQDLEKPIKLRRLRECGWWSQSQFIYDNTGRLRCDHLLRYEHLESDIKSFVAARGCPTFPLRQINVSQKTLTRWDLLQNADFMETFQKVYNRDCQLLHYNIPGFHQNFGLVDHL